MANNVIKRVWNQNKMVAIEDLKGMTFQAESGGHTFQISGVDDSGNVIALSGSVAGIFLRPDNTDVAITGSASGGVVSVTLPANCYDVPGRFGLTVFVTSNGQKTAVYAAMGTVSRTSSGTVSPGTTSDVVDLINRINAAVATIPASWTGLMADIAPTYSDAAVYPVGAYCYYNGDLYRCITAITTAESWTAGHWTQSVLGNDVSDLKSALKEFFVASITPITNTEHGCYNIGTHSIYDGLSSTRHITIVASEGDLLYVMGYQYNNNFPLWIAFDSSNNEIATSIDNTTGARDYMFIVPAGTVKVILNCSTNAPAYQKAYISSNSVTQSTVVNALAQTKNAEKSASVNVGTLENGVWNVNRGEYQTPLGSTRHIEVGVSPYETWYIAGYFYNESYPLWAILDANRNKIKVSSWNTAGAGIDSIVIPENGAILIVNCSTNTNINYARTLRTEAENNVLNTWRDKKIVWLGTSIPAGAKYGLNNYKSYPMIVGNKLSATVINEAVGESSVHCKTVQRVDATYNPYGFVGNWEKCARCLTNTVAEMEWLCENYALKDANDEYVFTENRPSSLSQSDIDFYKSCSYEVKIKNHLDNGDVDLWVFDHGHNDNQYDNNIVDGQTKTDDQIEVLYGKNNLYTWQGACNFIFTYILEADNKAKIVMIGEYDNRLRDVPPAQKKVAESWEFPFYKQWEVIGWNTDHKIRTTGYWDNSTGLWVESGGPQQEITIHDRFVRDHIHPSSDVSGYATEHIAQLMAKWFVNNSLVE